MRFSVTLDRDEDGAWVVECPSIPGCVSQGRTRAEALDNIREAIALCLEVRSERGLPLTEDVPGVSRRRERKFGGSPTQAGAASRSPTSRSPLPRGIARRQPLERALGGSRCPPAAPFAVRRTVLSPSFPDRELGKAGCRRS
jgi:predicted RNase H-like HicB family nuclease